MGKWVYIGEGSTDPVAVYDCRADAVWSVRGAGDLQLPPRVLTFTQTSTQLEARSFKSQMLLLKLHAKLVTAGLPYHFVVFNGRITRVYQLHDVGAWLAMGRATPEECVIALWGDYTERDPTQAAVIRLGRLARALEHDAGGSLHRIWDGKGGLRRTVGRHLRDALWSYNLIGK